LEFENSELVSVWYYFRNWLCRKIGICVPTLQYQWNILAGLIRSLSKRQSRESLKILWETIGQEIFRHHFAVFFDLRKAFDSVLTW